MADQERKQSQHKPASKKKEPPLWERAVAVLGLLLVLGALGFLLHEGIWGDQSPPDVIVERQQIIDSGEDYLVTFKARNEGGETAAAVKITGTLTRNGQQIEKSEITIDYVPSGSEQRGGFYFSHDPRIGELEFSASGYRTP
jgi:uncharacterized protein (TIGR02588 family)